MRSIFTLFFLLLASLVATAQSKENKTPQFSISGRVVQSDTKEGIEYAVVSITDSATKKIISGELTDNKGRFSLDNIKMGTCIVTVQFIGYADFIKTIVVTSNLNLPEILLSPKTNNLNAVTITGARQTIENKIDKLVYNVDKDITSQGGVATDVLKKIPMITVDVDGNVELLGNPSIKFLIDGKPSSIFANSVADALQSIPNSQIQSIEVITSPSAKYDASGTGGIINIILKKNKVEGYNGNVNVSVGTRLETGSLSASIKKNNYSVNAYFSGNAQLEAQTPNGMDRLASTSTGNKRLIQESASNFSRNGYKAGIGLDWQLTKKDNISAAFGYHHFENKNHGDINQNFIGYDASNTEISYTHSVRNFTNRSYVGSFDNRLTFKHEFKNPKQSLEISYDGSFDGNNTFYDQTQRYNNEITPFSGSNSLNPGTENEINLSIDYVQPIGKEVELETGFRTTFQSILSNADVFALVPKTENYTQDVSQSYSSDYSRKVYAGYVDASFGLFNYFEIKAGIRYEYTTSKAFYSNSGNVAIPDYSNVAPSIVISHAFNERKSIKFGYSYRIERPDYRDLNPFLNLSDPHNIVTGNPNLQPEIGNNFELGYNQSFENGTNINIVLFHQINSPDIKPYVIYYPSFKVGDSTYTDVTLTTRADLNAEIKTGGNIALSLPIGKKFTVRPNVQLYNRFLRNNSDNPQTINSLGFRTNLNATYVFDKQWAAEIFGNYNLGMKWQGQQPSLFSYTIAVRKQILKNKGSFGLVAVNAFNKFIDQQTLLIAQNLVTNSYRNIPYRSFGVSFSYKFGKLKFGRQKEGDNYLYTPPTEN